MRLTCPHCGTRDRREFTYQGAALARPAFTDTTGMSDTPEDFGPDWDAYLHLRDNPAGDTRDLWYHDPCGTWIEVHRNTVTHAVHGSSVPGGAVR